MSAFDNVATSPTRTSMSHMSASALAIRKQVPHVRLPKRPARTAPAPSTTPIVTIPHNTSVGSHHTRDEGGAVVERPQRDRLGVRCNQQKPKFAPWRSPYIEQDEDTSDDAPVTNSKAAPAATSKAAPKAPSKDRFEVGCGQAKRNIAPRRKLCTRPGDPD